MTQRSLIDAVEHFANIIHPLSETDLERPWAWGSYDSEGIRFACFRTYEELHELAATTIATRTTHGPTLTETHQILAYYHAAHRDLQAILIGADDALDQIPAENEWPLRTIIEHIIGANIGFFVAVKHAITQLRAGISEPTQLPDNAWETIAGKNGTHFEAAMRGTLAEIHAYAEALHQRILSECATINATELDTLSRYWETESLSLRFRLHRFDSHIRQHSIQAEKALSAIGRAPSETMRLLRLIYAALAHVEGAAIGAEVAADTHHTLASTIAARADEIATIIRGS